MIESGINDVSLVSVRDLIHSQEWLESGSSFAQQTILLVKIAYLLEELHTYITAD